MSHSGPSDDDRSERQACNVIASQAIVARGDSAVLEAFPQALDDAPAAIGLAVERQGKGLGGQGRDHGLYAPPLEPAAQKHGVWVL